MRRMFSENQIGKIAKYVAQHDLSDVDLNVASINANGGVINGALAVTGAGAFGDAVSVNDKLTAKSLFQTQATYDLGITITPRTNVTFSPLYMKAVMLENKLNIICLFSAEYTGDVTQARLNLVIDELPVDIASKIVDAKGITLSEDGTGFMHISNMFTTTIRTEAQLIDVNLNYATKSTTLCRPQYGTKQQMIIQAREGIPAGSSGAKYYYELRGELTII